MSTRTVSARIDDKTHTIILEMCNRKGMTVNQFIHSLIDGMIFSYTDVKTGDICYDELSN